MVGLWERLAAATTVPRMIVPKIKRSFFIKVFSSKREQVT
jgi:hypothetical protein